MSHWKSNGPIVSSSSSADSQFLYLLFYVLVAATIVAGSVTAALLPELF